MTTTQKYDYPKPGVRLDWRTGQYFPTINGKDESPTSFEEERALDIAQLIKTAI
jgi:hypothetical protein